MGEVAPPREFIFTALVTISGPLVPEEGVPRKCQVEIESFFKPAHPLLADAPAPIIRYRQRFHWAKDVPLPPPRGSSAPGTTTILLEMTLLEQS